MSKHFWVQYCKEKSTNFCQIYNKPTKGTTLSTILLSEEFNNLSELALAVLKPQLI